MDGIGFSETGIGDAVTMAHTPVLDKLLAESPNVRLKAHGEAVGLPGDDDMGNSEVGHNALGCGQVYSQGAKLVNEAIESGRMFGIADSGAAAGEAWSELINNCKDNGILHFIGLLSDGNVHSNIAHLFSMLREAKKSGIKAARVHILLDGRDVPATSALDYVEKLEDVLTELNDETFDGKIASGGGRMKLTMDRYQADWAMVERGWKTHVLGEGRNFSSAKGAIEAFRSENPGIIDQDLPGFVIAENSEPVGKIIDGDSVILFNFRGDRAIEISMAFDRSASGGNSSEFPYFDRVRVPDVCYAGMLQYDGDLQLPARFLVNPPEIKNTLSELLVANKINQYAVSETQKFGHVTYFWNGNRSGKTSEELETFKEIPSDKISFDLRPWMKSAEITDDLIEVIKSRKYGFIRCNFPNGDMVGHTGNLAASIIGVETVDLGLSRLIPICEEYSVTLIVTADHGNADEMLEKNKKGELELRTAHSLNKVPFIIYDKENDYKIIEGDYGLANVAPTLAKMLGLTPPVSWEKSMI
jgi:2,3-bisphosphoglycerate-independent phosphoglycerate mutase